MNEASSIPEKPNKKYRWIIVALFLIMTAAGLLVTPDYGMPWDELTEIKTLGTNIREYIGLVHGADAEPTQSSTGIEIPDVTKNVDIDHGQSVYYPFSPALFFHYGDGGARTLMLLWHGYTFLIFMAGVVAIYFIASYLAKNWRYGLVASLLLYLSPRFFAESHYNNKDVMAMVMILICLWFAIRFIERKTIGDTILFALFGALAANMRISGLAFFGLCGVLYLVTVSIKREWSWKALLLGVLAIVSFVVFYATLTPGLWKDPVKFISYVFSRSSNFSDWPGYVFYMGHAQRPVPWHYIPVMIAVTTPIVILILMLAGNVAAVLSPFRNKAKELFAGEHKYYLLMLVFVWAFLGFAMITRPILYDNWRHFYFLYGLFILLAVYGLREIVALLKGRCQWVAFGVVGAHLIMMLAVIILSHPFQFVYFNAFAGSNPGEKFDLDYWNVSQAKTLMDLIDTVDSDEQISVTAAEWYTGDGLEKAYNILPESYQKRMRLIFVGYYTIARGADYLMVNPRGLQLCSDKTLEPRQDWISAYGLDVYLSGLTKAVSESAFGSEFMTVYQMP
ncbi:MAG: glycosyltransferase family 39 protein [Christensenella sp.]|nr:glycosyltransferase family 39 protein [Christensenella sp.]